MTSLKPLVGLVTVLLLPLLAGCVGVAAEGANIAKDRVILASNLEAAQAGDVEAQYRVGKALCCSLNEGEGFYDTPRSVEWLCTAARQGHGPSAYKLGEIYSGDVISGLRVMRRVAQRVAGSSTNPVIAYAWMQRAEEFGVEDAGPSARALWQDLSAHQRSTARVMLQADSEDLPCEWQQVIGHS